MAKSKAYLFRGVEIRWSCDTELIASDPKTPDAEIIHYPNGLTDYLKSELQDRKSLETLYFQTKKTLKQMKELNGLLLGLKTMTMAF